MMADFKCGLAVRIISGIFPFLELMPAQAKADIRWRIASEIIRQKERTRASTRTRNQALCHYIDTHTHTHTQTEIGPLSTAMAQNVSILGKYFID